MSTFERFTDRARRVLVLAQEEARLLGHSFLGTEHILLGLIHEGDGIAAQTLDQLGVTLEACRQRVGELVGTGAVAGTDSPSFTPRAKKVMELALKEALQLDHNYIGTEHLLLGLVREGQGMAAQVLVGYADMIEVRKKVIKLLREHPPDNEVRGVRSGGWVSRAPGDARLVSCSFCGRRSPETGRLVASGRAAICEHCIRDWHGRLEQPEEPAQAPEPQVVEPPDKSSKEDE